MEKLTVFVLCCILLARCQGQSDVQLGPVGPDPFTLVENAAQQLTNMLIELKEWKTDASGQIGIMSEKLGSLQNTVDGIAADVQQISLSVQAMSQISTKEATGGAESTTVPTQVQDVEARLNTR